MGTYVLADSLCIKDGLRSRTKTVKRCGTLSTVVNHVKTVLYESAWASPGPVVVPPGVGVGWHEM